MEFWLMQDSDKLQLPVPPADYSIKESLNNGSAVVEGVGEVSFLGKPNLATIPTIVSFFPNRAYGFCQYSTFPTPGECVDLVNKWVLSGKPIRYLVTNTINLECTIEGFEHGEQDGTGDVYFSLDLKEYKRLTLATTKAAAAGSTSPAPSAKQRTTARAVPKTYKVVSGDTLYGIAKRLTGNGANSASIATKNKLKNPNLIYPGQVLQI